MMKRIYKEGIHRQQAFLLPPRLDEYVAADHPVRAIDAYVDSLNLEGLGFKNTSGELTPGQPAFPPEGLLKLYLYGYLHRTRSSRRLEAECLRNLEVIWLLNGLRPGYKTIADFRKDNLKALKQVNQDFVQVCKELNLFGGELVGIDGSFFRGNVAKASIFTAERLKRALKYIEQDIAAYLKELDEADQQDGEPIQTDPKLVEKLELLRARQKKRTQQLQQLAASGETQIAEVDEDARLLSKRGHGTIAGYNVQTGIDDKHKLMGVGEVVQDGNDEQQLEPMAKAAQAVLEVEALEVTADAGFFNAQQIKNCVEAGITPYVPEPEKTRQASLQGRFVREDFTYQAETNSYLCPAGKVLKHTSTQMKRGKKNLLFSSRASDCRQCPLQERCLPPKTPYRQVARWEHEAVIEAHRERMKAEGAEKMRQRAALCEHPFGTLKLGLGWIHFLLRGLEKVRAEFSLMMLAYNFRRVLTILGLEAFRSYCLHRRWPRPEMSR